MGLIGQFRSDAWDEGNYLTRFYEEIYTCDNCTEGFVECEKCRGVGCRHCKGRGEVVCSECDGNYIIVEYV